MLEVVMMAMRRARLVGPVSLVMMLGTLPLSAEVSGVTLKSSGNVKFL